MLALCGFAALALASGTVAAPPPGLRHIELVAKAERICQRYADVLQRPGGEDGYLGDPDYDKAWLKLFARQRRDLGALRPNARDASAYASFLSALPAMERAAAALMAALERHDDDRWSRWPLRRFLTAHAEATRRARAVGMRRCPGA